MGGAMNKGLLRVAIHDDISRRQFVIPGLTRNPVRVWIPAFSGMTSIVATYDAMYDAGV